MRVPRLFRVGLEVAGTSSTPLPTGWNTALLDVYLIAIDLRQSIERAEAAVEEAGLKPIDPYMAWEVDLDQWQPSPSDHPSKASVAGLMTQGGTILGELLEYDSERKDRLRLVHPREP
ncbi:MAG: hypothetical protein AAF648_16355 [Pseudomonadota bacterium]